MPRTPMASHGHSRVLDAWKPAAASRLVRPVTASPIFQAGHEGSIPFARSHCPGPGQGPYRPSGGMVLRTLATSFVPATCRCRAPWGQRSSPRTDPVRAAGRRTPADLLVNLSTMTTRPRGEVKTHLSELAGRVHDHHERATVTAHGRPPAVLAAARGPGPAGRDPGHHAGRRHDAPARRIRRRTRPRRRSNRGRPCRNNPQPPGAPVSAGTHQPCTPRTTPTARRALAEPLPQADAAAACQVLTGPPPGAAAPRRQATAPAPRTPAHPPPHQSPTRARPAPPPAPSTGPPTHPISPPSTTPPPAVTSTGPDKHRHHTVIPPVAPFPHTKKSRRHRCAARQRVSV